MGAPWPAAHSEDAPLCSRDRGPLGQPGSQGRAGPCLAAIGERWEASAGPRFGCAGRSHRRQGAAGASLEPRHAGMHTRVLRRRQELQLRHARQAGGDGCLRASCRRGPLQRGRGPLGGFQRCARGARCRPARAGPASALRRPPRADLHASPKTLDTVCQVLEQVGAEAEALRAEGTPGIIFLGAPCLLLTLPRLSAAHEALCAQATSGTSGGTCPCRS